MELTRAVVVCGVWMVLSVFSVLLGNAFTESVLGFKDDGTSSNVTVFNTTLPGVSKATRISTTISDVIEITCLFIVGVYYQQAFTDKRPRLRTSDTEPFVESKHLPQASMRGTWTQRLPTYLWSALAPYLRMGDSFHAAGVVNFWVPLAMHLLARIGALLVGAIPGVAGGAPSLLTQLGQGLVYAKWRRDLNQALGVQPSGCPGACTDGVCYAFCCCLMAAEDAEAVDAALGVRMTCCSLVDPVGEPISVHSSMA
mmetsp:Transcript_29621/g.81064  ORF Transcript_29621/g.81064 Transcript_29621/m.81064 type:complete len:255 (+) Transcript_29621:72-836(+)